MRVCVRACVHVMITYMYTQQVQDKAKSVYNTPPVWCLYILNLMLKWVERHGGVECKPSSQCTALALTDCVLPTCLTYSNGRTG